MGVLPSELLPWRNGLRPVKDHLTTPLAAIYRDASRDTQVRGFAADTLADYLSDDAEGLFDLLADADEKQFGPIFSNLTDHHDTAIDLGNSELNKVSSKDASEADKEALAMRQANAAVMLVRMDAAERVWLLLRHSPDPRVRSYIIHWLGPRGGDPKTIINRFGLEADVTIKRALLLCLGEFSESRLSQHQRKPLTETLLTVYHSESDSGLHAAAEWLLRKWGQAKKIAAIDKELQEVKRTEEDDNTRQWYINSQGQTFVILDDAKFQMGSPDNEAKRNLAEDLHRRRLNRQIAVCTKEVTRGQWRVFVDLQPQKLWGQTEWIGHITCPQTILLCLE